jgi:hypothetical protein
LADVLVRNTSGKVLTGRKVLHAAKVLADAKQMMQNNHFYNRIKTKEVKVADSNLLADRLKLALHLPFVPIEIILTHYTIL